MRVLVACEFSGVVREAFAKRGHEAWSCDLLPTEIPGNHIQGDVLEVLDQGWDLMVAHPPCTFLCSSGIHWNKRRPERQELTIKALNFVITLWQAQIGKVCIENPIGVLSTLFHRPHQIIQPYHFGEDASKRTCLWFRGLPCLLETKFIAPRITADGKYRWSNQTDSGQNRLTPSETRSAERSRTYQGIADAFANQWG